MIQSAEIFNVTLDCINVGGNEDWIAYWVTTSKCVFLVDREDGYIAPGGQRICKTEQDAKDYVVKALAPTKIFMPI